jgi:CRP/FNR family transcriptional regulator, cyclic AMP receptor protein
LKALSRRFREVEVTTGDAVVIEGRDGAGFFLITNGTADIKVRGRKVATLGKGDHFGEVSLLDSGPCSATVTATTELSLLGLSSWEFKPFVEEHPNVAWKLLQALVGRVRATDKLFQ